MADTLRLNIVPDALPPPYTETWSMPSTTTATTTIATTTTADEQSHQSNTGTNSLLTGMPLSWIAYNVLVRCLLYGSTTYMSWISFNNSDSYTLFCWHAPLMMFGFSVLSSESILSFSNHNLFTHQRTHRTRVYLHWLLQLAAAACTLAGLLAVVFHKLQHQSAHFATPHAIVGIVTVALTVCVMLGGLPTKYAYRLRSLVRPVLLKCGHTVLALQAYGLAVVAIGLALSSQWFADSTFGSSDAFWSMLATVVVGGVLVIGAPLGNLVGRLNVVRRQSVQQFCG